MRRNKKGLALLLALLLPLAMLLSGCAQSAGPAASAEAVPTQEAAGAETAQDAVAPPEEAAPQEREITDMAGRTMTVPLEIESVFSTGPAAAIYLYTLVPDKLLGWNYALNDIEKSIILEQYHDLPNFGQGDAVNYEAVIAAGPTIALNVTSINDGSIDASDALAEQLEIGRAHV